MPGSGYGDIPFADDIKALIDALETTINTLITGLETIIDDVKTSIEAVNTTIASLETALAEYDFKGLYKQWDIIPSDTLLHSDDDIDDMTGSTWVKLKEFPAFNPTNYNALRNIEFRFKCKVLLTGQDRQCQFRKNDIAWSQEFNMGYGGTWSQVSVDLEDAEPNDVFSLWGRSPEEIGYYKDFRMYADIVLVEYKQPEWS